MQCGLSMAMFVLRLHALPTVFQTALCARCKLLYLWLQAQCMMHTATNATCVPTLAVQCHHVRTVAAGVEWDEAKKITTDCIAFTNHTVMPEALERWPVKVMQELLPRHVEIIESLDEEWCAFC